MKFFKTTFGQIFIAITLTVVGVLMVAGLATTQQVNDGFDRFVEQQREFFEGRGMWAKIAAVENIKEFERITNEFKRTVSRSILFSSIVGVTVGIVVSVIISDQITKPLSRLKDIVKNVAKNDYDTRAKVEGSAEIRELIFEFNKLIAELDRIEQLREDLVTDVAHELKTPLTKVRGQLEGVIDGVYDLDKENLDKVLKNVDQLEYLIERLQEMVQIKSGVQKLKLEKLNIKKILEEVISGFSGKEITMILDVDSEIEIEADEKKFREILDNLIGNAYKYTNEGKITITADEKSLAVSDTGVGIPKKDLPYIFERFYRVDKSRNKETGGLGLGLAIVKELVEAHGWTVEAESEEGKGSEFTILF